ncbi:hypothetical protein Tco_1271366, partial [Tanacetum coccineum]
MASTRASISKAFKRPKINIIPPKELFVDLTHDGTKTSSPTLQLSSPSAPNAPSKTPSTKDTSSSSIDYIPKSPTSSTSLSPNGYLNPPTQENASMDITFTLSPITPLDCLGEVVVVEENYGVNDDSVVCDQVVKKLYRSGLALRLDWTSSLVCRKSYVKRKLCKVVQAIRGVCLDIVKRNTLELGVEAVGVGNEEHVGNKGFSSFYCWLKKLLLVKIRENINDDSVSPVASASTGAEGPIPPKTAKQKLARINEQKVKSTLMLAIPDEHLLKFHAYKDAKSLW